MQSKVFLSKKIIEQIFPRFLWRLRNYSYICRRIAKKNMSPVFKRESEYTFKIYSNEEERMHVHVIHKGHEAKLVSVLMINAQGIMLSVQGHDYFLSYNRIPWMQDAPIRSVLNVQMSGPEAIEWPDLDVDLEIDSLRHPERYPLLIKRNPLDYVGV